jgi:hypothetical protein
MSKSVFLSYAQDTMKQLPVLEPGDKPRKATWSVRKDLDIHTLTHTQSSCFIYK